MLFAFYLISLRLVVLLFLFLSFFFLSFFFFKSVYLSFIYHVFCAFQKIFPEKFFHFISIIYSKYSFLFLV